MHSVPRQSIHQRISVVKKLPSKIKRKIKKIFGFLLAIHIFEGVTLMSSTCYRQVLVVFGGLLVNFMKIFPQEKLFFLSYSCVCTGWLNDWLHCGCISAVIESIQDRPYTQSRYFLGENASINISSYSPFWSLA